MAQSISPMYGSGKDGDQIYSVDTTVNTTSTACSGTAGTNTLTVTSSSGFNVGDRIFIHHSRGTTSNIGGHEVARINTIASNVFTLDGNLDNTYTGDGDANVCQCTVMPEFSSVTINSSKTISPNAWNGTIGGIIAFCCSGQVNVSGNINASEKGYRGQSSPNQGEGTGGHWSVSTAANGNGGGGGSDWFQGAGGGNGSAGHDGGYYQPVTSTFASGGAASGAAALTTMTFGGAGGGGSSGSNGGNGGGIIFILANALNILSSGTVSTNGGAGGDAGGGLSGSGSGGGAGGSILVKAITASLGTSLTFANGGVGGFDGSYSGSDGHGADGRIRIEAGTISGTASPTISSPTTPLSWLGSYMFAAQLTTTSTSTSTSTTTTSTSTSTTSTSTSTTSTSTSTTSTSTSTTSTSTSTTTTSTSTTTTSTSTTTTSTTTTVPYSIMVDSGN